MCPKHLKRHLMSVSITVVRILSEYKSASLMIKEVIRMIRYQILLSYTDTTSMMASEAAVNNTKSYNINYKSLYFNMTYLN